MTGYHIFVSIMAALGSGFVSGILYAKHGLGWVSGFEAQIKADIAGIIASIEHLSAQPQRPPTQVATPPPVAPLSPPPAGATTPTPG